MESRTILIAGGGIGGLAAAIALRRSGFDVRVFERAPEIREVGAGLTIQSNAVLALRRIGLDRSLLESGQVLRAGSIRKPDGKVLSRVDLEEVGRAVGAPVVAIHRARLQQLLFDALGAGGVETGREVAAYETRPDGVTLLFRDGGREEGGVLIGADGLRSAVRAQMLRDGEPLYAGYTCWRGVTAEGGPVVPESSETWGRGRRFGIVPIEQGRIYSSCARWPKPPRAHPVSSMIVPTRRHPAPGRSRAPVREAATSRASSAVVVSRRAASWKRRRAARGLAGDLEIAEDGPISSGQP